MSPTVDFTPLNRGEAPEANTTKSHDVRIWEGEQHTAVVVAVVAAVDSHIRPIAKTYSTPSSQARHDLALGGRTERIKALNKRRPRGMDRQHGGHLPPWLKNAKNKVEVKKT